MTPCNKIKREILLQAAAEPDLDFGLPLDTDAQVEAAYDRLTEAGANDDFESEFREGECTTDIPAPSSRHYESRSVARELSDGTWVGWTYWYGGGKHGDPGGIDWMGDAYDLVCGEVKTVVVRTFHKAEEKR